MWRGQHPEFDWHVNGATEHMLVAKIFKFQIHCSQAELDFVVQTLKRMLS